MARLEKKDVLRIAKQKKVKFIRQTLGDHVFHQYVENKKIEWERYRAQVTDYELEQYLAIL
jgi:glutamine synthetase